MVALLGTDPAAAARRGASGAGRLAQQLVGAPLYGFGWLVAKAVKVLLLVIGLVLYGVGWAARRVIWPALVWMGAAVRLGWEEGRTPAGGGGRGPR